MTAEKLFEMFDAIGVTEQDAGEVQREKDLMRQAHEARQLRHARVDAARHEIATSLRDVANAERSKVNAVLANTSAPILSHVVRLPKSGKL